MISFKDLKADLRADTHPSGVPENLSAAYNKLVAEALIELQRWVPCLQENNTNAYPFCSTYWDNNLTVVPAPRGRIKRVYTVPIDNYSDKVFYRQATYDRVLECARYYGIVDPPTNAGLITLPPPFRFPESSLDRTTGRARQGYFAINNQRLYVYPWIHSKEVLIIEWDGLKRDWADDDLILSDLDYRKAIRKYVQSEYDGTYGHDYDASRLALAEFTEARRDLMYECREETRVRDLSVPDVPLYSDESCKYTQSALPDDVVESETFACVSDYGFLTNDNAAQDVATLVDSWGPSWVVTMGDNIQASGLTYAGTVGALYGDYIDADPDENRFHPALGNHDLTDGKLNTYLAYFHLKSNQRYYDFVRGGVHFFMLNGGAMGANNTTADPTYEPDGLSATSAQAQWLRLHLSLSNYKWRVVIVHQPPYTTNTDKQPGYSVLRWPFKAWGASVVLSGHIHAYERFEVDGFPYIVAGVGGATAASLVVPPPAGLASYLKSSYTGNYGALKATVTCDTLKFEFINRVGTLIDTLTLTQT